MNDNKHKYREAMDGIRPDEQLLRKMASQHTPAYRRSSNLRIWLRRSALTACLAVIAFYILPSGSELGRYFTEWKNTASQASDLPPPAAKPGSAGESLPLDKRELQPGQQYILFVGERNEQETYPLSSDGFGVFALSDIAAEFSPDAVSQLEQLALELRDSQHNPMIDHALHRLMGQCAFREYSGTAISRTTIWRGCCCGSNRSRSPRPSGCLKVRSSSRAKQPSVRTLLSSERMVSGNWLR